MIRYAFTHYVFTAPPSRHSETYRCPILGHNNTWLNTGTELEQNVLNILMQFGIFATKKSSSVIKRLVYGLFYLA